MTILYVIGMILTLMYFGYHVTTTTAFGPSGDDIFHIIVLGLLWPLIIVFLLPIAIGTWIAERE